MKLRTVTLGALLLGLSGLTACGKQQPAAQADVVAPAPAAADVTAAPPARVADAAPTPPEAPDAAPDAGPTPAAVPDAGSGEAEPPPVLDRATMQKAYVEIYCAQRRGEATELLALYKKYGFNDPETWTRAWEEHAKDSAWVAQITAEAIQACP